MAKIILHPMFASIRGRVGDMVIRTRNGQSFASRRPTQTRRPPSEAALHQRLRFTQAMAYATAALQHPPTAAFYAAVAGSESTARRVATRDFLRPPEVEKIALGLFAGEPGDEIVITATDDTEVAAVHVAIKDMNGRVLESGSAQNRADDTWTYAVAKTAPAGQPLVIAVTAKDRPGNTTTGTATWVPRRVVDESAAALVQADTWLGAHQRAIETSMAAHPRLIT